MISTVGFSNRRRRLMAEIRCAKRKAKDSTGARARALQAHIVELEEQVALIDCIQEDADFAVKALYDAQCYGPPQ